MRLLIRPASSSTRRRSTFCWGVSPGGGWRASVRGSMSIGWLTRGMQARCKCRRRCRCWRRAWGLQYGELVVTLLSTISKIPKYYCFASLNAIMHLSSIIYQLSSIYPIWLRARLRRSDTTLVTSRVPRSLVILSSTLSLPAFRLYLYLRRVWPSAFTLPA